MMSAKQGPIGTAGAVSRSEAITRKSRDMKVCKVELLTAIILSVILFFETAVLGGRPQAYHTLLLESPSEISVCICADSWCISRDDSKTKDVSEVGRVDQCL